MHENQPKRGIEYPYPYADRMKRKPYEKELRKLQVELLKVQRWVAGDRQKIALLFEGRDAAGKGSTIKRFTEHLNPRQARVVALPKPSDVERGQWYFQRYVAHLPTRGEIVFFDRSWYNRAGVEPVMGFCKPSDYQRFIHQVPHFEDALIESGLHLFKLWFDVGREEQFRRIESRRQDPLKHWKLSPMDQESIDRFDAYTKARNAMFLITDSPRAPWTVIRSDDKKRARLSAIRYVLSQLDYPDKDPRVVRLPDPLLVGTAAEMLPLANRSLFGNDAEI
ncbi:MAG: polyphosphate kinase 2 [Planctomycetota bacterium]|nr:MAG: polyphosphate kinase 2 [Planctomycetota bacterium]REJ88660.1 MAG: polyphosphate kinase 2 [Planctomycetota bacterium]REK23960.1 MAG: polyphosphate kinase 2 [Planctomycetota bacterium]REK49094.1 MAG: polyphosphate kinase 2 [Planctomycetota bacterium]